MLGAPRARSQQTNKSFCRSAPPRPSTILGPTSTIKFLISACRRTSRKRIHFSGAVLVKFALKIPRPTICRPTTKRIVLYPTLCSQELFILFGNSSALNPRYLQISDYERHERATCQEKVTSNYNFLNSCLAYLTQRWTRTQ